MVKAIRVVEVCTSDIGVGAHQSEPKVRERKRNKVLSFSLRHTSSHKVNSIFVLRTMTDTPDFHP